MKPTMAARPDRAAIGPVSDRHRSESGLELQNGSHFLTEKLTSPDQVEAGFSGKCSKKQEGTMPTLLARVRFVLGALALACLIALAVPVAAQQPSSVNPTASSVNEQKLLQQLQRVEGRISIPDEKAAVLIQPEGRDWRRFHEVTLRWIGGIAIIGMLAVLVIFYL